MSNDLLPLRRLLADASGESPIAFAVAAGGLALLLAGTLQAFEPEISTAYERVALAFSIDRANAMDEPATTAAVRTLDGPRVSPRLYGKDKYLREYD